MENPNQAGPARAVPAIRRATGRVQKGIAHLLTECAVRTEEGCRYYGACGARSPPSSNHFELGHRSMFLVDDDKTRQRSFTVPVSHIPVLLSALYSAKRDYTVSCLAIRAPIMKKNPGYLEQGGHFHPGPSAESDGGGERRGHQGDGITLPKIGKRTRVYRNRYHRFISRSRGFRIVRQGYYVSDYGDRVAHHFAQK